MQTIEIHGYAIVSDDDRIADAKGETPPVLQNDADWAYFQAELDRADITVLGRLAHEANPNARGRARLVLSTSASGLEQRSDAWWWNPTALPWAAAIKHVLPGGGRVAVPGGKRVFDLFLDIGYDVFHLSRAEGVSVGAGVTVFSRCDIEGVSAEAVLSACGLRADPKQVIDPAVPVSLTVWRRG